MGLVKEISGWSLRGRISLAVGFICGVLSCGWCMWQRLAEQGCKADMTFGEYCSVGAVGIAALFVAVIVVGGIIMGITSLPLRIGEWMEDRKLASIDPSAVRWKRERLKDNLRFTGGLILTCIALAVGVLVLGSILGYIGWLLFC